jgi:uncharacterized protein (DUF427 family)
MAQLLEDHQIGSSEGEHRVRLEECPKRVRAFSGAVPVADSRRVTTLFETGHLPVYYFPRRDVRTDLLEEADRHTFCPYKGTASYYRVLGTGREPVEDAAWAYPEPLPEAPAELAGLVAFYWEKMDAWFEEDEEVFVHARDPYKRIDVLHSSRHLRVELNGETVAETTRPCLLFETGLPTRYYIPKIDVRLEALEPSERTSRCPYKGTANYHSVRAGGALVEDVAWFYRHPTEECSKIANMICFFNEKVDLYLDGERLERPRTAWS